VVTAGCVKLLARLLVHESWLGYAMWFMAPSADQVSTTVLYRGAVYCSDIDKVPSRGKGQRRKVALWTQVGSSRTNNGIRCNVNYLSSKNETMIISAGLFV